MDDVADYDRVELVDAYGEVIAEVVIDGSAARVLQPVGGAKVYWAIYTRAGTPRHDPGKAASVTQD